MTRDLGSYVCSEKVKIGKASAALEIHQSASIYVASWKCSCGAIPEAPVKGLSIGSATENGKASYRDHCAAAHRVTD
jgi:hypothetical protein